MRSDKRQATVDDASAALRSCHGIDKIDMTMKWDVSFKQTCYSELARASLVSGSTGCVLSPFFAGDD